MQEKEEKRWAYKRG